MPRRTFMSMVAAAVVLCASSALAELEVGTFTGKVVTVAADGLTMVDDRGGSEFTLPITDKAATTLDGEPSQLAELATGSAVEITIAKVGGEAVVTKVEAKKGSE